jgi:hypothetical protein
LLFMSAKVGAYALAKRLAGFMASPLERLVGRHFGQHSIPVSLQICSPTV